MNNLARIFISRKFWIALAGVASCLVVVFNADPEKWTPLIASIVTLAGTVIASIAIEDAAEKRNEAFQPVPPSGGTGTALPPLGESTSRGAALLILLLGVLLLVVSAGGCWTNANIAKTPEAKWALQRQALTSANKIFDKAVMSGLLDDKATVRVGESLQLATIYLDAAKEQINADGSAGAGFDNYLNLADRILQQVEKELNEKAPVTVSPNAAQPQEQPDGSSSVDRPDRGRAGSDRQRAPGGADGAECRADFRRGLRADREGRRDLRRAA